MRPSAALGGCEINRATFDLLEITISFDLDSDRPQSDDRRVDAEVLHDTTGKKPRELLAQTLRR